VKLNRLGRSGLRVSELALGTMNFGSAWHGVSAVDEKTARDLIDVALEHGVNLIDTADIYGYGAAETMLGKILGKRRRAKVHLATKVLGQMRPGDPKSGGLSRRRIGQALDESLKRLRTDYVDLYMPHGWDVEVPLEETLEALHRAVAAGKVRVLGCSNFTGAQLRASLEACAGGGWSRFEFDQVQYSLAFRAPEDELAPVAAQNGVSLMAWSPLGGGLLSGRPARTRFPNLPEKRLAGLRALLPKAAVLEKQAQAQVALSWLLGRPGVACAVVGASSVAQLEMDLTAGPISRRSREYLDRASELCALR
jgi:aryl-alcohol dehydrogenase-like predicted oxidoreductase